MLISISSTQEPFANIKVPFDNGRSMPNCFSRQTPQNTLEVVGMVANYYGAPEETEVTMGDVCTLRLLILSSDC